MRIEGRQRTVIESLVEEFDEDGGIS